MNKKMHVCWDDSKECMGYTDPCGGSMSSVVCVINVENFTRILEQMLAGDPRKQLRLKAGAPK